MAVKLQNLLMVQSAGHMLAVKAIKYVTNLMMSGAFLLLDILSGKNKVIFKLWDQHQH